MSARKRMGPFPAVRPVRTTQDNPVRRAWHRTCAAWAARLAAALACGTAANAGNYADAVWLDYQESAGASGDVILIDAVVEEPALYTYYAALVWNTGYMGLQRGGSGFEKHVHFSIWDSPDGTPVEVLWKAPGVVAERFGGEGTGFKAMWEFNWQTGVTYRLCVTLEAEGGVTDYKAHFLDPQTDSWKHLATMRRFDKEYSFSKVSSFIEDFGGTAENKRAYLCGNGWLRKDSGDWIELKTAKYEVSQFPYSCTNHDVDVAGHMFRAETGGAVTHDTPIGTKLCARPLPETGHPLSIGHRGASLFAPENTRASFDACIGCADLVEFDVRPSADGDLVVMHDGTVDRTTDGSGSVAALTTGALAGLDAGSWFSDSYAGQRIPTMADAVASIASYATPLIEHKAGTAAAYVGLLNSLGLATNVVVQSFDYDFLRAVHALDPSVRLAALGSGVLTTNLLDDLAAQGVEIVSWAKTALTPMDIHEAHRRGLDVFVWTVDGAAIDGFAKLGVDGIISNDPHLVHDLSGNCSARRPLADGLVAYWKLDDGQADSSAATAIDVEKLNDGTLVGFGSPPSWSADSPFPKSGCLSFDGVDDHVAIPRSESLDIGTNALTLSAWVRMDSEVPSIAHGYGSIYDSAADAYVLYQDRGNKELRFKVTDAAGDAARPGASHNALAAATWHHLAAVFNGSVGRLSGQALLFLDGRLVDVHTGKDGGGGRGLVGAVKTGQIAMLGRNGSANDGWFAGQIDDVAVWRRALSAGEIRTIHRRGLEGYSLQSLVQQLAVAGIGIDPAKEELLLDACLFHGTADSNAFFVERATDVRGPYTSAQVLSVAPLSDIYRVAVPMPPARPAFFRVGIQP